MDTDGTKRPEPILPLLRSKCSRMFRMQSQSIPTSSHRANCLRDPARNDFLREALVQNSFDPQLAYEPNLDRWSRRRSILDRFCLMASRQRSRGLLANQ